VNSSEKALCSEGGLKGDIRMLRLRSANYDGDAKIYVAHIQALHFDEDTLPDPLPSSFLNQISLSPLYHG